MQRLPLKALNGICTVAQLRWRKFGWYKGVASGGPVGPNVAFGLTKNKVRCHQIRFQSSKYTENAFAALPSRARPPSWIERPVRRGEE